MKSFPHGFHCTLVRFAKGQMLLNHMLQHEQHVPFRMVTLVTKQGVRLSSCDLFVGHGFLDQFCDCHFIWAAIFWYIRSRIYFQVLHCMQSKESREVLQWPSATRIPAALGSCPVAQQAHHAPVAIELFEQPILPGEWPGGALIGLTWYNFG